MVFLAMSVRTRVSSIEDRKPRIVRCGLWNRPLGSWEGKSRVVTRKIVRRGRRSEYRML